MMVAHFAYFFRGISNEIGSKAMTTGNFWSPLTGWVAIATGASAILAVIFLTLMFTVNMVFGAVNDAFNSIIGISSAVLAWMLFAAHHARSPWMSQIALVLAILGAIFCIVGSVLVMYGFSGFVLAGWYTGVGNALIGLWLAAFCYSMQQGEALPRNLLMLGLITGALMAFGLIGIPGIFARVDSMEAMPWFLYAGFFGYLGTYVLYPIWTIWLGRTLLLR
jgi:hypothetical protein